MKLFKSKVLNTAYFELNFAIYIHMYIHMYVLTYILIFYFFIFVIFFLGAFNVLIMVKNKNSFYDHWSSQFVYHTSRSRPSSATTESLYTGMSQSKFRSRNELTWSCGSSEHDKLK